MGQKVGKAAVPENCTAFVNLAGQTVAGLWREFNLSCEGWSLDPQLFKHLCAVAGDQQAKQADALFAALDTDKNNLVDGLEFLSLLGLVSAMTASEKLLYIFSCFDLRGSGCLSQDELCLLLKSSVTALCKLSGSTSVAQPRLEDMAKLFVKRGSRGGGGSSSGGGSGGGAGGVTFDTFSGYFSTNPITASWLSYYDDIRVQESASSGGGGDTKKVVVDAAVVVALADEDKGLLRTELQEAVNAGDHPELRTMYAGEQNATDPWMVMVDQLKPPPPLKEEEEHEEGDEQTEEPVDEEKKEEPPPPVPNAPNSQLSLEWVHGLSMAAARASIRYTKAGSIAYPAGRFGIILAAVPDEEGQVDESAPKVQHVNMDLTDVITVYALSPCRTMIAAGETGILPKVVIFDAATSTAKTVFRTNVKSSGGIARAAWSPCSSKLATIRYGPGHPLEVYDVATGQLKFSGRTEGSVAVRPLAMCWADNGLVISSDDSTLSFWVPSVAGSNGWERKKGIPGQYGAAEDAQLTVTALTGGENAAVGSVLTGSVSGAIYMWRGRNCTGCVKAAHEGPITCLSVTTVTSPATQVVTLTLISGGKDGKVRLWGMPGVKQLAVLDMFATTALQQQVISVDLSTDGTRALVVTSGAEIFELSAVGPPPGSAGEEQEGGDGEEGEAKVLLGRDLNGGALVSGHCTAAIADIAVKTDGTAECVTAGGDATVRLWSLAPPRKCLRTLTLDSAACSVAFSADGALLAVGLGGNGPKAGSVLLFAEGGYGLMIGQVKLPTNGSAADDDDVTMVRFSATPLEGHAYTLAAGARCGKLTILASAVSAAEALAVAAAAANGGGGGDDGVKEGGADAADGEGAEEGGEGGAAAAEEGGGAGGEKKEGGEVRVLTGGWAVISSAQVIGTVTQADFTVDCLWVMVNSSDKALAHVSFINTLRGVVASPDLKELMGSDGRTRPEWRTWSCTQAHGCQGAWLPQPRIATTTSADVIMPSDDGVPALILTGDSMGRLALRNHPALLPPSSTPLNATSSAAATISTALQMTSLFSGHPAGGITAVRSVKAAGVTSTEGGIAVLSSAGGTDKCLLQWSLQVDEGEESGEDLDEEPIVPGDKEGEDGEEGDEDMEEEPHPDDEEEGEDGEGGGKKGKDAVVKEPYPSLYEDNDDMRCGTLKNMINAFAGSEADDVTLARSRGADKSILFGLERQNNGRQPWLTTAEKGGNSDSTCPTDDLSLEWVHGYNAQKSRSSLFYNTRGMLVYPAACLGVMVSKGGATRAGTAAVASSNSGGISKVEVPGQINSQSFHCGHYQSISSLTRHPNKVLMASGQEGDVPLVLVWDSITGQTVAAFAPPVKGPVTQLVFSSCGTFLAVACNDINRSVFVYQWKTAILKCRSSTSGMVLVLAFSADGTQLLAAGKKHFKIFTIRGSSMSGVKGLFGSGSKVQSILCAVALGGESPGFVMGAYDGTLLRLDQNTRKVATATEAHEGPVYALYAYQSPPGPEGETTTTILSGGKDGVVHQWDEGLGSIDNEDVELTLKGRANLTSFTIRSLCVNDHSDSRKVAIGTAGSEIVELMLADGKDVNAGECVTTGHSARQLWGLSAHPAKQLYATCGEDMTLREWDVTAKKQVRQFKLDDWSRCCCYSPNGLLIAVGQGGPTPANAPAATDGSGGLVGRPKNGCIKIVSGMEKDLRLVNEVSDAVGWINDIKFSPDGKIMGAVSSDANLYLYDVHENFTLKGIIGGAPAPLRHLDFSADGRWIRAMAVTDEDDETIAGGSGGGGGGGGKSRICETVLYDLGKQELSTMTESEVLTSSAATFLTSSCPVSLEVRGIWPGYARSPLDIGAVSRSNRSSDSGGDISSSTAGTGGGGSGGGSLVASAHASGEIRLWRYPCSADGASGPGGFKSYAGHGAGGAPTVAFTTGDTCLLSVGSRDRCVFQWRRQRLEGKGVKRSSNARSDGEDSLLTAEMKTRPALSSSSSSSSLAANANGATVTPVAVVVEGGAGGKLMTSCNVNGRGNVFLSVNGSVVFASGKAGVVYHKPSHSQVQYMGHNDDITCVTVSKSGEFAATGDASGAIKVWSTSTAEDVMALPPCHNVAITRLAFSSDGRRLASVGGDINNTLCIHLSPSGQWSDGGYVCTTTHTSRQPVLFVAWTDIQILPLPPPLAQTVPVLMAPASSVGVGKSVTAELLTESASSSSWPYQLVTGGVGHVTFWSMYPNLTATPGVIPDENIAELANVMTCAVSVGSQTVTGTSSGHLLVWQGASCVSSVMVGGGGSPVYCLAPTPSGGCVSGNKDGMIQVWDANMQTTNVTVAVGQSVVGVTCDRYGSRLAAATAKGEVHEVVLDSLSVMTLLAS